MRLHGNDIDETTTAIEADLGWIVGWKKDDFLGAGVLRDQKARGAARKIAGFEMMERGIGRHGYDVYVGDTEGGRRHQRHADAVPEKSIGMATRPTEHAAPGTEFDVDIRGPPHARARRADAVLQAAEVVVGATMAYPTGFKYTKDHEWIDLSGDRGKIGITDYAQQQLGDVVYVELPEVGARLKQGQSFGTIESVKAVSELYSPVTGEVVEVNTALKEKPEGVNADPTRAG
jgi:glycine cleavage system H protein